MSASLFRQSRIRAVLGVSLLAAALAGCGNKQGDIIVDDSVGIAAVRSPCPSVAVPNYTGDMTLFSDPARTDSGAIDVTASITNLRSTCNDSSDKLYTVADFDVLARRTDTRGARTVTLPYFSTVVRGSTAVVAKRLGTVTITFADGQERASGHGKAAAYVDRAEATLPEDIRERLTRKRKSGDEDAAIDPLSQPDVRTAIARASFELLIGFQLTEQQLAYNATR